MFVCCECCVLSGRGLCDELITPPEEFYRLWCVVVCDLETSRMRMSVSVLGRSATKKKKLRLCWDARSAKHQNLCRLYNIIRFLTWRRFWCVGHVDSAFPHYHVRLEGGEWKPVQITGARRSRTGLGDGLYYICFSRPEYYHYLSIA